jgi:hypothetical protein
MPEAPQVVQINKTVEFKNCPVNIEYEGDVRVLCLFDPLSGTQYRLPLTADGARQIGQQLISSVPVIGADEMPGANGGG